MLCSECKKNAAILFYNKVENGKETMEGLCYDCAKKKGINPLDVLSKQSDLLNKDKINLNDMSKQLETVFKDLAENINLEDIENMDGAITFNTQDEDSDDEDAPKIAGAAIPLGSIFSNMFGSNRK
ncbi:aTPase AAA-2 domain protein [Clostridium sp. CAG:440]|jgi:ATPase AAA-2 domain protein|nr:aTPase AAA-2 domain protein [Clostridium sp. CAG:440]HJJ15669.1 hypothetical protein [Clostridiaceae bacterium]